MSGHLAFLAIMLLSASCFADAPTFLIYRDTGGRIQMVSADAGPVEIHSVPRRWSWEGYCTSCKIETTADGFEWHWKIDIEGPGWAFVDMQDTCNGLAVTISHTLCTAIDSTETRYFRDYDQLLADKSQFGSCTAQLMRRLGQNPQLPRIGRRTTGSGDVAECTRLIKQLDSPDPRVRRSATHELSRPAIAACLSQVTHSMHLSPEQRARIDAIESSSEIEVDRRLLGKIERLASK